MTRGERPLFGKRLWPVIKRPLGPNQHLVLRYLREGDSLADYEAGALIHAFRDRHSLAERCDRCEQEGRAVLTKLREKGLVVRRQVSGRWEAIGQEPDRDPGELPEGF